MLESNESMYIEVQTSVFFIQSSFVELVLDLAWDLRKRVFWIQGKKFPGQVQGIVESSWFVLSLGNELSFESLQEFQMGVIFFSQGFLTNNCLHGGCVLCCGIVGIQLVGDWGMIWSILFNSFLHQTGQRWQHVDRRVNLLVVQLSIDEDLALSDVTSQIWDRVSDIIVLN